jgi:NAD(P)-dependent dehydrogenase (short-subunit alcohol dehydrogenase family)
MNRVEGKVAIVTGAGSRGEGVGNGRAASVLLAREGARVLLLDREESWLEATLAMARAEGGEVEMFVGDVTDADDCKRAVAAAVARWGRLDVLVNNVGVSGARGTAVDVDPEEWELTLRVNVTSMMLMAKFAIPEMVRGGGGSIVNLASVAGLLGGHPALAYPTTKGAVVAMTRAMAAHHGRDGVRVNCVCPGFVYTPMVQAQGMTEGRRARRRQSSLMPDLEGTGWDVGQAVLWLASDDSRFVTGVALPVDAGTSAGWVMPVPQAGDERA